MYVCMYVCMCSINVYVVCMYGWVGIAVSIGRQEGLQSIGSGVLPELCYEDGSRG